ncbi:hypothetical protein JZX87_10060 [Agrobacterium sp. Ap1]|uniref:phage tail terminator-like protein n=1 Tax=Agrobacterium sp. Ap1 TaxID=2815337 RepID=UPI001A8D05C2|nr:phage tail terminator-like protein [Agrobacterium sp. Ap1]MBO0141506.1 hypothetical protein [Agrobacterium sp. Ap1]
MIRETDIELALKAAIEAGNLAWPVAWPNQDLPGDKPHIVVEIVRVNRRDETLAGESPISLGRLIATVVVAKGTSTKVANEKADAISELFPMARRIAVPGGEIVILKPADVMDGYPEGADWRVPVRISYEAS